MNNYFCSRQRFRLYRSVRDCHLQKDLQIDVINDIANISDSRYLFFSNLCIANRKSLEIKRVIMK